MDLYRLRDDGTGIHVFSRLRPLILLADEARARTNRWPLILLPSRQPPGLIGEFAGYRLHRLRTIHEPMVVIAGRLCTGRPAPGELARYRAAEFTGTYYTTTDYSWWAVDQEVPRLFASYLDGCGLDASPAAVTVKAERLEPDTTGLTAGERRFAGHNSIGRYIRRAVRLTARAVLIVRLLPYPACGNWLCVDDADWAEANPVSEPAVFAGGAAERRRLDVLFDHTRLAVIPRELIDEQIAYWRRRADGQPLWTIDIRPQSPGRI